MNKSTLQPSVEKVHKDVLNEPLYTKSVDKAIGIGSLPDASRNFYCSPVLVRWVSTITERNAVTGSQPYIPRLCS